MNKENMKVVIKQTEEAPVAVEVLAQAIISIDVAAKKLLNSGLNEKAIVTLLAASMPSGGYGNGKVAGTVAIRAVLRGLADLRREYCTK